MKLKLLGCTIESIRPMTKNEVMQEGWRRGGTAIVLNDGTVLFASRDGEGNDSGVIFGRDKFGRGFML